MGNFEKLSVLVIGVIIVMILVVALYTWTDDPAGPETANVGAGAEKGRIAEGPRSPGGQPGETPGDGWDPWVTPADPKPAKTVAERPDEKPLKVEKEVATVTNETEKLPPETVPAHTERTYTVKAGDTLGQIALEQMGSTKYWKLLADHNGVDPMKLRPDTTLLIPEVEHSAAAPNKTGTLASAGGAVKPGGTYTVRKGDTIQKISQSAYRTIERWTDIWFANMERLPRPDDLREGMTLEIPN